MHADIHHLLSLRDGEPVDVEIADHVRQCAACESEMARLSVARSRLQSMPAFDVPAAAWDGIRTRIAEPATPPRRIPWAVAAALVVTVVSGLVVREWGDTPGAAPVAMVEPIQTVPTATGVPLEELVAQSRQLDEVLQYLPQRPAVERVSMAVTIDTIQQRVQWLDQQLSYAPETGLDDEHAYRLWTERVALMDSLVKVRYVEGSSLSF